MEDNNAKLCKLLGINPKYKLVYGMLDDDFWILDKEQCENHINNTKNIYYTPHIEDKEVYPDLSAPSNFVKLLNIIIKTCDNIYLEENSCSIDNCFYDGCFSGVTTYAETLEEAFIKCLLDRLVELEINEIKYLAQQTDWEY